MASAAQTCRVRIVHGPIDRIRPPATQAKPPTSAAAARSVSSAPSARRRHRRARIAGPTLRRSFSSGRHQQRAADEPVEPEEGSGGRDSRSAA